MISIRKPKNALIMLRPSSWWGSQWRTALPLGNGVVGASVLGGAAEDAVMITHADLWWQGRDSVLQDVADKIKDVRKALDLRDPIAAESILSDELIRKNFRPQVAYPLPLCDFKISTPLDKTAKEYARILNMETGEATVTYKDGATRFERSCFVSRARNLIAYEMTRAGQASINVEFSFDVHEKFNARTPTAISATPEGVSVRTENYFLYYSARSSDGSEFGAVAKINFFGGKQTVTDNSIIVKGAEKVLVLIEPFVGTPREKAFKNARLSLAENKLSYDKLLKEHVAIHSRLFLDTEFDLDADGRDTPIDELLIKAYSTGTVPASLTEKLWAFGRYLFLTGTSPSSRPLAPYGLWCGDYKGHDAQIDAVTNLQNSYSFANSSNFGDFMESVFHLYESVFDDLKKNASRLYGCRGIFVPTVMSPSTGVVGKVENSVVNFTGAAGYIARMFYEYYLYTADLKFLKNRALPFMKEAVTFYEEFFKLRDASFYESSPSYSYGSTAGNLASTGEHYICKNATVDFTIARELITNMIEGSEKAGLYKSEIPKWKDMLTKIPPYKINADGTVAEYNDSYYTDNPLSPSLPLFYAVYPSYTQGEDSGEVSKALLNTAKKKYQTARSAMTAPSLAAYANIFARLGDSESAFTAISSMVDGMLMDNLVMADTDWRGMGDGKKDVWTQPSIQANISVTNALQEMIVQSDEFCIRLLPAVPQEFTRGSLAGISTRVGVEITELNWDIGRGTLSVKLKSRRNLKCDIQLPKNARPPKKIDADSFDAEKSRVVGLNLPNGKVVTLEFRL